jgi:putative transposase
MTPPAAPARYKPPRLPGEILRPGVWLSERFPWSSRAVPALLWARGSDGIHDARRPWGLQGGQDDAKPLQHRRAQLGEPWPLDAVFLTRNGERHALGRAVEPADNVLALLGQRRRHTPAAQKVFRPLLQGLPYGPWGIITAPRKRYGAAKRERLPGVAHRQRRSLTHRGERSQRPTRQRE